jgi:hypothetical protein
MKRIVLAVFAAVFCVSAINISAQPQNASPDPQDGSEHKNPIIATRDCYHPTTYYAKYACCEPPGWYTSFKWPKWTTVSDWWLVIVTALTGIAIVYQSIQMKRTTDLMRVQMRQWVDFENWRGALGQQPEYVIANGVIQKQPDTIDLEIYFDVVNNTRIPLTLQAVKSYIADRSFVVKESRLLAPRESYPVIVPIVLRGEQVSQFLLAQFMTGIRGTVSYKDAMKKKWEQPFGRTVKAGLTNFSFFAASGKWPEEQKHDAN